MTFINNFANLNMGNFMSGWNNWFPPTFSCSFMPSLFDLNSFFTPMFNNWSFPSFNNFSMPSLFNFSTPANFDMTFQNNIWNDVSFNGATFTQPSFNATFKSSIGDTFTLTDKKSNFSLKGYNQKAGIKLAECALSNSKSKSTGYCARYVKKAIQNAGLGTYQSGDAYQMTEILRHNNNFKEVSPSSVNVKELPAGCVIVFNKGAHNKYSPNYGHVEITTGDGRGVSDYINTDLKKPNAIFIPV